MDLDARNVEQVAGHSVTDADLGIMGRRLLVISGIAMPEWTINSDEIHRGECRVLLRVPAENVEQSTIHVGLASIGNDDTAWAFATDTARLETSEQDELVLVVNLALLGEPSDLHRFSYQVVVVKRIVVSEITGTIRWSTSLFIPEATLPSAVADNVHVMAHFRTLTTATPGPGSFGGEIEHLTPAAPGQIISLTVNESECFAGYIISNPPKGQELKVVVTQDGFFVPPPTSIEAWPLVDGDDVLTITPAQPTRNDLDFEIVALPGRL